MDISACYLTLLYALHEVPFDPTLDPYAVEGFSREQVKDWVKIALGAGKVLAGGNPFAKVRKATLSRHPILEPCLSG